MRWMFFPLLIFHLFYYCKMIERSVSQFMSRFLIRFHVYFACSRNKKQNKNQLKMPKKNNWLQLTVSWEINREREKMREKTSLFYRREKSFYEIRSNCSTDFYIVQSFFLIFCLNVVNFTNGNQLPSISSSISCVFKQEFVHSLRQSSFFFTNEWTFSISFNLSRSPSFVRSQCILLIFWIQLKWFTFLIYIIEHRTVYPVCGKHFRILRFFFHFRYILICHEIYCWFNMCEVLSTSFFLKGKGNNVMYFNVWWRSILSTFFSQQKYWKKYDANNVSIKTWMHLTDDKNVRLNTDADSSKNFYSQYDRERFSIHLDFFCVSIDSKKKNW